MNIPARPYLPFSGPPGGEVLQPETARTILDTFELYLAQSFK